MKSNVIISPLLLLPMVCLQSQLREANQAEASRIWEQMIDAKGGRTQLYLVDTMVQETHQHLSFHNPKFKDGDNHIVRAFAFPDRVWDWSMAPLFGGSVRTANLTQRSGFMGYPKDDVRTTHALAGC